MAWEGPKFYRGEVDVSFPEKLLGRRSCENGLKVENVKKSSKNILKEFNLVPCSSDQLHVVHQFSSPLLFSEQPTFFV
jgi:hypothetical protein